MLLLTMASDYKAIRATNERLYGTDIQRVGRLLLADRYDDRTHFIYELLQNAEDALSRRKASWRGSRAVTFDLSEAALRIGHYGQPFDGADVKSICGIAESTKKELTEIGCFGIGFKSVYTFTDRPEIHSGMEDFAIESFVWPVAAPEIERKSDETVIVIPLYNSDKAASLEIAKGLQSIGAASLLFLQNITEIQWSTQHGKSGLYLRQSRKLDEFVRRVKVIGQQEGEPEVDESWLVFSKPVQTKGQSVRAVEIAFRTGQDSQRNAVERVERSPLVVFFPTVVETHLGFLTQGPYRTTPSRDNVPRNDSWNQRLVAQTASLLVEALCWLRDRDRLDTTTLNCLPLDPDKFEGSMFAELFKTTKATLLAKPLLPRNDEGYSPANRGRLARTQELRDLLNADQLSALLGERQNISWLSAEITQDRTPELREYLMKELEVVEITPEMVVSRLTKSFLEKQSDSWVCRLYEFLTGQPALRWRFGDLPLIRLADGSHVVAHKNGMAQAFLPSAAETGFPTVRLSVCSEESAMKFLDSLGLTAPDLVDDVVRNLLPKYAKERTKLGEKEYEADLQRILAAFETDSKTQRQKLIGALKEALFVRVIDAGGKSRAFARPGDVYLATEQLKGLFEGVSGVRLVDDSHSCLKGENVRELLEACGAARHLQPLPHDPGFSWEQRQALRIEGGCENLSSTLGIEDYLLRGLSSLIAFMPSLPPTLRIERAKLIWDGLRSLEERRGSGIFYGTYRWYYYQPRSVTFEASFLAQLRDQEWVPDADGELHIPEIVLFETLGWTPHPFLESKIRFKPPILETLAREAGIELGVLDLLKKHGITSREELLGRLGLKEEHAPAAASVDAGRVDNELSELTDEKEAPEPISGDSGPEETRAENGPRTTQTKGTQSDGSGTGVNTRNDRPGGGKAPQTSPGVAHSANSAGGRQFVSYVVTQPTDQESDPDGLDHLSRQTLEEQGIDLILKREPHWRRTSINNPGFDLFKVDDYGRPNTWCEVKVMTGDLHGRPVGLSHTQFKHAQERGEQSWLYVVEHGGTEKARIVRIHNPAGNARTFTFDHGWLGIAQVDV